MVQQMQVWVLFPWENHVPVKNLLSHNQEPEASMDLFFFSV